MYLKFNLRESDMSNRSVDSLINRSALDSVGALDLVQGTLTTARAPSAAAQVAFQARVRTISLRRTVATANPPPPATDATPRSLQPNEISRILRGIPVPTGLDAAAMSNIERYWNSSAGIDLSFNGSSDHTTPIKMVYSSDPVVSVSIYTQLYTKWREVLGHIKLTPYAIDDYRTNLTNLIILARAKPYSTVGSLAADAIGAPLTQMTLNSFSSLTGSSVSYGLGYCREILEGTAKRKETTMDIHFRDKGLRFHDVLNRKYQFVHVSVGDLVVNSEIEDSTELTQSYWYNIYRLCTPFKYTAKGLRLYLNVDMMYAYAITMTMVVDSIMSSQSGLLSAVPSPLWEGVLDIYPLENVSDQFKNIQRANLNVSINSSIVFLCNVLLGSLDKITVSGIPGITDYFAIETTLWAFIRTESALGTDPSYSDRDNTRWSLHLNRRHLINNGLTSAHVVRFLQLAGFRNITTGDEAVQCTLPLASVGGSPHKVINALMDAETEKFETAYNVLKADYMHTKRMFQYPSSALYDAYHYVMVRTRGSNLPEILRMPDVDGDIVLSNDINGVSGIKTQLGIECARNMIIKDLTESLSSQGSRVDPKHLVFTADYLTVNGDYIGFTYNGMSYQAVADLDKVAFQRPYDVFHERAVFGSSSSVGSASSSIFIGQAGNYGSGAVQLDIDEDTRRAYERTLIATKTVNPDNLSSLLDELNDNSTGTRVDNDITSILGNSTASVPYVPVRTDPRPATGIGSNNVDVGSVSTSSVSVLANIPTRTLPTPANVQIPVRSLPVISGLLSNSVAQIPGIPLLRTPQPVPLPLPSSNLTIPPRNIVPVARPGVVPVDGVRGNIVGIPSSARTSSGYSVLPNVSSTPAGPRIGTVGLPVGLSAPAPVPVPIPAPSAQIVGNSSASINIQDFINM